MFQIRRSKDRGHADHGWLDTYHSFSFADYYDPQYMGFGVLRVLNQDRVAPGRGFGAHGHGNMEIVSYVLEGTLEHKDSMGNGSQMTPGEVQLMSAGSGVTHSEFNASPDERLHFLQMWILPAQQDTTPRYEQKHFAESERRGRFRLVVSPDGRDGSLVIGQDVRLYAGLLDGAETASLELAPGRCAWFHLARGTLSVNGEVFEAGDGTAVVDEALISVTNGNSAEFVLWDLPGDA